MTPAKDLFSAFIGNFRQIDDHLFAGAQPQLCEGITELIERFGIRTIVDLQGHDIDRELSCISNRAKFISIPLPGVRIITEPSHAQIAQVMAVVNDSDNWPVFVHCLHGADRTGAIVGIYRVEQGATAKEAIAEMRHYHNSWIEFGYRDAVEDFYEARQKGK